MTFLILNLVKEQMSNSAVKIQWTHQTAKLRDQDLEPYNLIFDCHMLNSTHQNVISKRQMAHEEPE